MQNGTVWKLACGFLFAFHSNYGSVLHQFWDKARYWSQIVIFNTPLHSTPRQNIAIPFGMEKLEWWGYRRWKRFEDTCNHLHTTPVCDGRTETSCHGIVRAMHTRRAVKTNVETLLGLILNEKSARFRWKHWYHCHFNDIISLDTAYCLVLYIYCRRSFFWNADWSW